MKKHKIFFLVLFALTVVAGVLLYIFLPPKLPAADNNTPARELISHYYSDEELERALSVIIESEYSQPYKYDTLDDLKHMYKFECLRDPRVYSEEYYPYIVLMSESGKKLFLFYDPQTLEIIDRTIIEDFMTLSEVQAVIKNALVINKNIIDDAVESQKTYAEVLDAFIENDRYLDDILWPYNTGTSIMSVCQFYLCGVEEGLLELSLWAGAELNVRSIVFYPNELLFGERPLTCQRGFDIWPVLPIDKTE